MDIFKVLETGGSIGANVATIIIFIFGFKEFSEFKRKIKYEKKLEKIEKVILGIVEIETALRERMKYWKNYSLESAGINNLLGMLQKERGVEDHYPFTLKINRLKELIDIYFDGNLSDELSEVNSLINEAVTTGIPKKGLRDISLNGGFKEMKESKEFEGFREKIKESSKQLFDLDKEILGKLDAIKIKIKEEIKN